MNELEKFLGDIDEKEDSFEQPLNVESEDTKQEEEDTEFKAKNRRERRLQTQVQRLREEAIAATARAQALSESRSMRETTEEADYLKRIEKIYGNETPEAREATELLKEALLGVEKSAYEKALAKAEENFENKRGDETRAIQKEEESLEEMMESVEDEFDVDMSNSETRKGFLTLLEKLSPKDKEGNIIEYADPITVYEVYESRKERSASRNKELARKHSVRSGNTQGSTLKDDATERFLKEHGII